jgi:hypothetical protein
VFPKKVQEDETRYYILTPILPWIMLYCFLKSKNYMQASEYKQEAANNIKRARIRVRCKTFTLSKLTTNIATGTGLSISFAG